MNYLDEDEELMPLDEEEGSPFVGPRRPFDRSSLPPDVAPAPPTGVLPDAPDPSALKPGPTPEMRRIIGLDAPPNKLALTDAPVVRGRESAENAYADAIAAKPGQPQPKWWQRLAAGALGAAAGYSNAAGRSRNPIDPSTAEHAILAPGYDRKLSDWKQNVATADARRNAAKSNEEAWWKNRQLNTQEDTANATTDHTRAQTANLPGQAVTGAIEHGGEIMADGQTTAPDGRQGSVQTIGGKPVFFPSAAQKEKDKKVADQASWQEISPEMAESLADLGVKAGDKVPSTVFNQYQRVIQKQSQSPKLTFQHFTNDQTGDVTTIGYDPISGEAKVRTVEKGIAQKQVPAMIQIGNQLAGNQDAVTTAATQYRQTRTMPPVGRNPMMAIAILKKVSELDKAEGISPEQSGVQAEIFKANRTALSDITKRESQVSTMEKTAGKNLDVFLQAAQKVADAGIVPATRVFRGAQKVFGDPNMAAFEAARVTAFTEISRVLSGSMSSVLSDSSRKEAESILRGDYTLPQLMRVAQTLRTDMKNRMDSFAEQKRELTREMGGTAPNPQQGAPVGQSANPKPNGYIAGHVYGGLTYQGGDPNLQSSWRK